MNSKLRLWRVVPTCKTGVQAPSFFVETTTKDSEKAKEEAIKLAKSKSRLGNLTDWVMVVEKLEKRKDEFGRYWKYHQ